jgi:hypothetical protein
MAHRQHELALAQREADEACGEFERLRSCGFWARARGRIDPDRCSESLGRPVTVVHLIRVW